MNIPKGTSYTETRRIEGKLVRMDIEAVADLFLDPAFHDGLFEQAAKDGKDTYEWDFGNGDIIRMIVTKE